MQLYDRQPYFAPTNFDPKHYWKTISSYFDQYRILLRDAQETAAIELQWSMNPVIDGPHHPKTIDLLPPSAKSSTTMSKEQFQKLLTAKNNPTLDVEREQRRGALGLRSRVKPMQEYTLSDNDDDFQSAASRLPLRARVQNKGSGPNTSQPSQGAYLLSGGNAKPKAPTPTKTNVLAVDTQYDFGFDTDFPSIKENRRQSSSKVEVVPETQNFMVTDEMDTQPYEMDINSNKNQKSNTAVIGHANADNVEFDQNVDEGSEYQCKNANNVEKVTVGIKGRRKVAAASDHLESNAEKKTAGNKRTRNWKGKQIQKDQTETKASRGWKRLRNIDNNPFTGMDDTDSDSYFDDFFEDQATTKGNSGSGDAPIKTQSDIPPESGSVQKRKTVRGIAQVKPHVQKQNVENDQLGISSRNDGDMTVTTPALTKQDANSIKRVHVSERVFDQVHQQGGVWIPAQGLVSEPVQTGQFYATAPGSAATTGSNETIGPRQTDGPITPVQAGGSRARKRVINYTDEELEGENLAKRKKVSGYYATKKSTLIL